MGMTRAVTPTSPGLINFTSTAAGQRDVRPAGMDRVSECRGPRVTVARGLGAEKARRAAERRAAEQWWRRVLLRGWKMR